MAKGKPKSNPKSKPRKGLLKRIRITGSGKIKLNRAAGRHLRSHKPGSLLRRYRKPKYAHGTDLRRVAGMLHAPVRTSVRQEKQSEADA